jgi:hypothetical protein
VAVIVGSVGSNGAVTTNVIVPTNLIVLAVTA